LPQFSPPGQDDKVPGMTKSLALSFLLACLCAVSARADFDISTEPEDAVVPSTSATNVPAGKKKWELDGKGINLFNNENGAVTFSLYMLNRYLNQLPPGQVFTDHLGNVHPVSPRNDIYAPQRVLLSFFGWLYDPDFHYVVTTWTVNAFDKVAVIGDLSYNFNKHFDLHTGTGGMPGSRSMLGSHPYWLGTDRVMADEFFRTGFTFGVWGIGEIVPGLMYRAMVGNNISTLGTTATTNSRAMATGGSLWWMPTTHEFGPKGAYGDFEQHQNPATRFGVSGAHSRENKATQIPDGTPGSTQIRLADSLLLFAPGALAPGVQVNDACFYLLASDWAVKYKGFFLQAEFYSRWLSGFHFDPVPGVSSLPVGTINDKGFYVQTSQIVVPKRWEVYEATDWVFGDTHAGFGQSHDWIFGANRYLWNNRNSRINMQFMEVYKSPTSSSFGYYQNGQRGQTVSLAWSINI
jgi:hypothetical protein